MGKKLAIVKLIEKARNTLANSPREETIEHRAVNPNTRKQELDIELDGGWVTIKNTERGTTILVPAANVRYAVPMEGEEKKGGK